MFTLICGRCRAGKTTYSQRYDNVIHLDDVSKSGRERYPKVREIVANHAGDIVVEGVYDKKEYREELLNARKHQWTRCIWLNTPTDVLLQRMGNGRIVPRHFEPPTYSEGWDEIIVIGESYH